MALEDEFDLVIEDEVGETFVTPQVVYDYVKKAKGEDDAQLAAVVEARKGEQAVAVSLDDL
jgi:hypothetical protein